MVLLQSVFTLTFVAFVRAAIVNRQDITTLSTDQISTYAPFTHFAGGAYCDPSKIMSWTCGGTSLVILPRLYISLEVMCVHLGYRT